MMGDASSRDLFIRFRSLREWDLTGLAWLPRLINGDFIDPTFPGVTY